MKVAVGLSGGVDSMVAAVLLKEAGYEVTGITMKLWRPGTYPGGDRNACFGAHEEEDILRVARLAEKIGIHYRVFDCFDTYDREVISYFRQTYLAGRTPNPCVRCNAVLKFGLLPKLAREAGCAFEYFVTGHYARIQEHGGRYALARALDTAKDQSYFLYRLSQEQLAHQLFPLGTVSKSEVRGIARDRGLLEVADRPDSQDFYSGDPNDLIGAPDRPGDIVDLSGRVLGHHNGFWHYTIGQRKGLGIGGAGEPYYVVELNACANRVVVGRATDAVKTAFAVTDVNWVALPPPEGAVSIPCRVKVRSAGKLLAANFDGRTVRVPGGVSGVAPGQSAVCYAPESDELLCGGVIEG